MKKLNITKEQFNRSRYFKNKYGNLEYVSESGKIFKTSKGKLLKFKESGDEVLYGDYYFDDLPYKVAEQFPEFIAKYFEYYGIDYEEGEYVGEVIVIDPQDKNHTIKISMDAIDSITQKHLI